MGISGIVKTPDVYGCLRRTIIGSCLTTNFAKATVLAGVEKKDRESLQDHIIGELDTVSESYDEAPQKTVLVYAVPFDKVLMRVPKKVKRGTQSFVDEITENQFHVGKFSTLTELISQLQESECDYVDNNRPSPHRFKRFSFVRWMYDGTPVVERSEEFTTRYDSDKTPVKSRQRVQTFLHTFEPEIAGDVVFQTYCKPFLVAHVRGEEAEENRIVQEFVQFSGKTPELRRVVERLPQAIREICERNPTNMQTYMELVANLFSAYRREDTGERVRVEAALRLAYNGTPIPRSKTT